MSRSTIAQAVAWVCLAAALALGAAPTKLFGIYLHPATTMGEVKELSCDKNNLVRFAYEADSQTYYDSSDYVEECDTLPIGHPLDVFYDKASPTRATVVEPVKALRAAFLHNLAPSLAAAAIILSVAISALGDSRFFRRWKR